MITIEAELEHYCLVTTMDFGRLLSAARANTIPWETARSPVSPSTSRRRQRSSARIGVIPSGPPAVCWRISPRNGATYTNISGSRQLGGSAPGGMCDGVIPRAGSPASVPGTLRRTQTPCPAGRPVRFRGGRRPQAPDRAREIALADLRLCHHPVEIERIASVVGLTDRRQPAHT